MNRITPFLWFDGRLEEAVQPYTSTLSSPGAGREVQR